MKQSRIDFVNQLKLMHEAGMKSAVVRFRDRSTCNVTQEQAQTVLEHYNGIPNAKMKILFNSTIGKSPRSFAHMLDQILMHEQKNRLERSVNEDDWEYEDAELNEEAGDED